MSQGLDYHSVPDLRLLPERTWGAATFGPRVGAVPESPTWMELPDCPAGGYHGERPEPHILRTHRRNLCPSPADRECGPRLQRREQRRVPRARLGPPFRTTASSWEQQLLTM